MAVAACARKEVTAGGANVAPAGDSMAVRAAGPDQIGGYCGGQAVCRMLVIGN